MQGRERIIRERFAEQTCTHCGAYYPPEGVLILARRRSTWMVMVSCTQCQQRGVFVVSFPDAPAHDRQTADRNAASEIPPLPSAHFAELLHQLDDDLRTNAAHTTHAIHPDDTLPTNPKQPSTPITSADVDHMHHFLAHFDGNFSALFASPRPRRTDDTASS